MFRNITPPPNGDGSFSKCFEILTPTPNGESSENEPEALGVGLRDAKVAHSRERVLEAIYHGLGFRV